MKKPLLIAVLALSACNTPNTIFPGPFFSRNFPPEGPPNYQQGMLDGCRTALGAVGSGPYGTFVHAGFHQDVEKALNDPVYYKAWKDAYFYCKYEHDKMPE
jgi:hypothetical protein